MTAAFEQPVSRSHERQRVDAREVDSLALVAASSRRAFTLIELLVVIGLIVIFVGVSALALGGRGGEGSALANGQNSLASLIGAARAQAALHHTNARLVIYAQQPPNGDSNKYLRSLIVVREEPAASGQFVAASDVVTLPTPICVVPPGPVPATHLRAGVVWNNNLTTGPVSTLGTVATFAYRGQAGGPNNQFFGTTGSGRIFYVEFDPTGAITSNTSNNPTKVALTTAVITNNAFPQFNNANAIRGLLVRKSGAISLVNDATGF